MGKATATARETYVACDLGADKPLLISTRQAKEVLDVPFSQVSALPNMPAPVLGLFNRRSRVIWLVDLAQLLGLPPLMPTTELYRVIVLSLTASSGTGHTTNSQSGPMLMAIAVANLRGSLRLPPDRIQPPSEHLSPQLLPYLTGCLPSQNELMLVLDGDRLTRSPLLS
jgi:positive phototaxis protein PixI